MAEIMRCYRHPKRETRVTCATCGRPICTDCMVPTDVGIKCPEDARLPRRARIGAMKSSQVIKSLLAGVAVALIGLAVVYFLSRIHFASIIISIIAGSAAGTFINRAGGRNGGWVAMVISGVAVFIAYVPFLVLPILTGAGNIPTFMFISAAIAIISAIVASNR